MINRRKLLVGLTSFVAAPAVVHAENIMPVHSLPKRYATVWGVGWDLEVVEHIAWTPQDALKFAKYGGGIEKFREVTDIVYGFEMPPLPKHWEPEPLQPHMNPRAKFDPPVSGNRGITNIVSFGQLDAWRESIRYDLGSRYSKEWAEEVMRLNELNGYDKYHGVYWKWLPEHLGS